MNMNEYHKLSLVTLTIAIDKFILSITKRVKS